MVPEEDAAILIHLKIKPQDKIISRDSIICELRNDVQTGYKEYSVINTNDSQEKLSKWPFIPGYSTGYIPLQVFPATCRKYCNFKRFSINVTIMVV